MLHEALTALSCDAYRSCLRAYGGVWSIRAAGQFGRPVNSGARSVGAGSGCTPEGGVEEGQHVSALGNGLGSGLAQAMPG
jgi:hypothetical protein